MTRSETHKTRPDQAHAEAARARTRRTQRLALHPGAMLIALSPHADQGILFENYERRAGLADDARFGGGVEDRVRGSGYAHVEGCVRAVAGLRRALLTERYTFAPINAFDAARAGEGWGVAGR
jgi:hypothetical protein